MTMSARDDSAVSSQPTIGSPAWPRPAGLLWQLRMWAHYERARLPWARLHMSILLLRRGVFARRPFHGNPYQLLRDGRLEIGRGTVLESNVTIQSAAGQVRIGAGVYLSRGVTVGSVNLVEIGDFVLAGPGCYITDGNHRHGDHTMPVPDQGMSSKGPTVLEDNVWLGANVVVTSGVRIGRRSVIGANSVVTRDVPAYAVAAGIPARIVASAQGPDSQA